MSGGLANVGNTCSINSLVQCLGHCPSFRKLLLEADIPFKLLPERKFSLFQELRLLLHQLWVDKKSVAPVRFLKAYYESLGDLYQPGEQFDFTEMWMLTLNNLMEETHQANLPKPSPTLYKVDILDYIEEHSIKGWSQLQQGPITDLVHGIQVHQIKCNHCQKISHSAEPFNCTYLEAKYPTLGECFTHYYDAEIINDWTCEHCKAKEGEKLIRFWKFPKIWVIILKRFNQTDKEHRPITLTTHFDSFSFQGHSYKYELKAMANHYGSLQSGHYTAFCKDPENNWSLYDDQRIYKNMPAAKLMQDNTCSYVLFFEQV